MAGRGNVPSISALFGISGGAVARVPRRAPSQPRLGLRTEVSAFANAVPRNQRKPHGDHDTWRLAWKAAADVRKHDEPGDRLDQDTARQPQWMHVNRWHINWCLWSQDGSMLKLACVRSHTASRHTCNNTKIQSDCCAGVSLGMVVEKAGTERMESVRST